MPSILAAPCQGITVPSGTLFEDRILSSPVGTLCLGMPLLFTWVYGRFFDLLYYLILSTASLYPLTIMRLSRLFWVLIASVSAVTARSPTVTLKDAVYIGTTTQVASATTLVDKFLGIPYAATPERFRAARPRPPGSLRVNATEQPPACIQQCGKPLPPVHASLPCPEP